MNANKQFINLVGILLFVVILVAGVALVAMPMYAQAQTIDSTTRDVALNNAVYEQQVAALTAAEADIETLDAELATRRAEIPATPQLDDVHEIIAGAARKLDVRLESVTVDDPTPFIPRDELDDEGNAVEATEAAAAPAAPAENADETAATQTPAAEDAGAAGGDGEALPTDGAVDPDALTPQQQLLVTITVDATQPFAVAAEETVTTDADVEDAPDAGALTAVATTAARLVDELGRGPRLLTPIDVDYIDGKVVIVALVYLRAEDAS